MNPTTEITSQDIRNICSVICKTADKTQQSFSVMYKQGNMLYQITGDFTDDGTGISNPVITVKDTDDYVPVDRPCIFDEHELNDTFALYQARLAKIEEIRAKTNSIFDPSIIDDAVDKIPGWYRNRFDPNEVYYVVGLIESLDDLYWVCLIPDSDKIMCQSACIGIGDLIEEWSSPDVAKRIYELKLAEAYPTMTAIRRRLAPDDTILYMKLFKEQAET